MRQIILQGPAAEKITIDGKSYLYFGGTNYLGMASRPEVLEGAKRAIDRFGLSSSASRTSTGTNTLHLQVESALSTFAGSEAAILLSSGYLAMQCTLEGLVEEDDFILLQDSAHPSIRQAVVSTGRPYSEFDAIGLDGIRPVLNMSRRVLVVAEGVSPLTGAVLPLPDILELLQGGQFRIVVDDAHGLGVTGTNGRGTAEYHKCDSPNLLSCATLSKAFGAFGGCVLPDRKLSEVIRTRSLAYICATPPSAADLGAALTAIELVTGHPEILGKLRDNVTLLKRGLSRLALPVEDNYIPIVPIRFDDAQAMAGLSERLFLSGIVVPYINYPGSPKGGLIRLVVTAAHTAEQIELLLDSLARLI